MIRKIKTSVNGVFSKGNSDGDSQGNNNSSFDMESRNAQVEELDLNVYNNENSISSATFTEETVLNAIEQNFSNNRNVTNQMNNQIYDSVMKKIAQYGSNSRGNF